MPLSVSNTSSSSKIRIVQHSPSLWIFAGCAGALITLAAAVVLYVQRRRFVAANFASSTFTLRDLKVEIICPGYESSAERSHHLTR